MKKTFYFFCFILFTITCGAQTLYQFPVNPLQDSSTDFQNLINSINSSGEKATIEFINETILNSNHTVNSNVHLKFRKGGLIKGSGVLTINTSIQAGHFQIFDINKIINGKIQTPYLYPQWYGAVADDSNPDDVAINKTIELANRTAQYRTIFFPSGNYLLSAPIILKQFSGIKGENLRGTVLKTTGSFTGSSMITNDDGAYYNNIENFLLENDYVLPNMVMIDVHQQWEGSYIKNIHLSIQENSGVKAQVKGGIWHTKKDPNRTQSGGGQYAVENINAFYGLGLCKEEFVKLENDGGLYLRKWNINSKHMTNQRNGALVSLKVTGLVLDASDFHLEVSPAYNTPSIIMKGGAVSIISLTNSDIVPYLNKNGSQNVIGFTNDELVGIEIDIHEDEGNTAEWNIENVTLKSGTGGNWYVDYKIPVRLKTFSGDTMNPVKVKDFLNFPDTDNKNPTIIRKFTKNEISMNRHVVDPHFQNTIGIKEGIINQQTIGTLGINATAQIFTPHLMSDYTNGKNREDKIENYTLSSGNNYQAKGYMVFISAMDTWGVPKGGLFQVLTTYYEGTLRHSISPQEINGVRLEIDSSNKLNVKNTSPRSFSRTNVMILGTGTEKQ